jgi:hypothetical protein
LSIPTTTVAKTVETTSNIIMLIMSVPPFFALLSCREWAAWHELGKAAIARRTQPRRPCEVG